MVRYIADTLFERQTSTPNGSVIRDQRPGNDPLETNWNSLCSLSRGVDIMTSRIIWIVSCSCPCEGRGGRAPRCPWRRNRLEGERDRPTSTHAERALSTLGKAKGDAHRCLEPGPVLRHVFLCPSRIHKKKAITCSLSVREQGDMDAQTEETEERERERESVSDMRFFVLWVMAAQAFFPRL
jgi:hypothetical protein